MKNMLDYFFLRGRMEIGKTRIDLPDCLKQALDQAMILLKSQMPLLKRRK